jgi:hypothetical protein
MALSIIFVSAWEKERKRKRSQAKRRRLLGRERNKFQSRMK